MKENNINTLQIKLEFLTILGVFNNDKLVGYGTFENHTCNIPQLHLFIVEGDLRLFSLKNLLNFIEVGRVKIINSVVDYDRLENLPKV